MAFLKFSRDGRGYENFYLLEPSSRGKERPRLLYWFRTPSNIKFGRLPFDREMRRTLEAQNPSVAFDWPAIVQAPIPPPANLERRRERRRAAGAMRVTAGAQDVDEAEPTPDAAEPHAPTQIDAAAAPVPVGFVTEIGGGATTTEPPPLWDTSNRVFPQGVAGSSTGGEGRRRRRRRRRRRPQPPPDSGGQGKI